MYRLLKFGQFYINFANQVDDIGSGRAPSAYQVLPSGGAIDLYGSRQTYVGTTERTKSARIAGISESAANALYLSTLSLVGKRDKLYRRMIDGTVQWMYARFVELRATRSYEITPFKTLQDVELAFVGQEATWKGDYRGAWSFDDPEVYFDSGYSFDSGEEFWFSGSPLSISITCGEEDDPGREIVRAVRITVTCGTSALSGLEISRENGESISYSETLAPGESLVIDIGSLQASATSDEDAYDHLTLSHLGNQAWFSLEPGENLITVSYSGGGSGAKISFDFYEVWK